MSDTKVSDDIDLQNKEEDTENEDNDDNDDNDDNEENEENYDYDEEDNDEDQEDSLKDDVEIEDEDVDELKKKKKKKETCLYNYVDSDEDDYDDDSELSDGEDDLINKYVQDDDRITKPILTHYEYVRLLGIRTKQISAGAKPMIKNSFGMHPKDIAKLEIKNKVVPLIIEREIPNGTIEKWRITELDYVSFF